MFVYENCDGVATLQNYALAPDGTPVAIPAEFAPKLAQLPQVLSTSEAYALAEKTKAAAVIEKNQLPQNTTIKMQMYDPASGKFIARSDNNTPQMVRVETQGTLTGGTPLSIVLDATALDANVLYGIQVGGGLLASRLLAVPSNAVVISGTQGADTVAVVNQAVLGNGFTTVDVQITVAGSGGNIVYGQEKVVERFQAQNSITATSILRQTVDVTANRNESTLNNEIINLPNERFKFNLLEGMILWIQGGQKYTAKMKIFSDSAQVGVFQKV